MYTHCSSKCDIWFHWKLLKYHRNIQGLFRNYFWIWWLSGMRWHGLLGHKAVIMKELPNRKEQRWMQSQGWQLPSAASHKADEALQLTAPGYRAMCPGDLPNLSQSFLSLIYHKNFLLFVFKSLTLCSSNSISSSSVSFSQCPLWSVPLSLGFTSVGFPVSDSYFFCSNNLLNFVFKHMDSFAFLLLFSKGAVPICSDRLWGAQVATMPKLKF